MSNIISNYFESNKYRKHIKTATFQKGEVILRPYDEVNLVYAITDGLIKLYNIDSRGKVYISVIYGPGDLYPLAWFMNKQRPQIYFQAISDSTVQIVPMKMFQKHMNEDINLYRSFVNQVFEQFAYFATSVNNFGLKYGWQRLYYKFLVLASKFGNKQNGFTYIPRISHSELGATISVTREGVSKEITKLEKLGVLDKDRENIIIKDTNYLQKELGENIPIVFFDYF